MIKKIAIKDYRSCIDTTFDLHPKLSVLIGPNSSGKTNILNALLLLRKLSEENEFRSIRGEKPTAQCKIKVWFDIGGKTVILTATIYHSTDENNNDVIHSSEQRWFLKDFTGNAKRAIFPLWLLKQSRYHEFTHQQIVLFYNKQRHIRQRGKIFLPPAATKPLELIGQELSEIRYYSASQFTNPANCPVSFEIEKEGERSRGLRLRGHAKFLFDLYNEFKLTEKSRYQQFFEIIGPRGIALIDQITFKEIPTSSIDYSVRSGGRIQERKREKLLIIPQFKIGKNELSPNQLSEGTFKTITLLFYLVTETSKVLMIEEPEVCVHHGLLSSIIELIKTYSENKQIIVSTHSDFVLDEVEPENVYKVTNSLEKGTKVFHIPKAMPHRELTALRKYLESEGNLGEYWRHGGLD